MTSAKDFWIQKNEHAHLYLLVFVYVRVTWGLPSLHSILGPSLQSYFRAVFLYSDIVQASERTYLNKTSRAGKMTHWGKVPAAKPDGLRSVPGIHRVEREDQFLLVRLWVLRMHCDTCMRQQTHTYTPSSVPLVH